MASSRIIDSVALNSLCLGVYNFKIDLEISHCSDRERMISIDLTVRPSTPSRKCESLRQRSGSSFRPVDSKTEQRPSSSSRLSSYLSHTTAQNHHQGQASTFPSIPPFSPSSLFSLPIVLLPACQNNYEARYLLLNRFPHFNHRYIIPNNNNLNQSTRNTTKTRRARGFTSYTSILGLRKTDTIRKTSKRHRKGESITKTITLPILDEQIR